MATTPSFLLALLFSLLLGSSTVQGKHLAFLYDGVDYVKCWSGTYDVEIDSLKIDCGGEGICERGETVAISGKCKCS
jgi:hypothetical protein